MTGFLGKLYFLIAGGTCTLFFSITLFYFISVVAMIQNLCYALLLYPIFYKFFNIYNEQKGAAILEDSESPVLGVS